MDIFAVDMLSFMSFVLTFIRVSIIIVFLPFFGGNNIPMTVKVFTCLVITLALWPQLSLPGEAFPAHPGALVILLLREGIFALTMGLCIHIMFAGIQTGGQLLGMQMGFAMLSFADPLTGAQTTVTSHLLYMTSMVVFLSFDGHLQLLRALTDSFSLVPAGSFSITALLTEQIISFSGTMFSLAVRIAGPVIAALFLAELTLALMGRAAPQMNLLTMGFPIKTIIGFFFIGMLFTLLGNYMEEFVIGLRGLFTNLMLLGR